jgi:hypothetical protein
MPLACGTLQLKDKKACVHCIQRNINKNPISGSLPLTGADLRLDAMIVEREKRAHGIR